MGTSYYGFTNPDDLVDGLTNYINRIAPSFFIPKKLEFDNFFNKLSGKIWVKIKTGKFKDSIGTLSYSGIYLGNTTTNAIKKTGLELLEDYTGSYKVVVVKRKILDIFDVEIDEGDKIIYADRGKLQFGIVSELDFSTNTFWIATLNGRKSMNTRKSQFVNVSQINETFIEDQVLIAKLLE